MWMLALAFAADEPAADDEPVPTVEVDERTAIARGTRNQADPTDELHLFYRGFVAGALNPSGVQVDVAGEIRAPVLRFGGIMSNTTFIGAGLRGSLTPVHMDIAARVSFQPLDILPITVEAFWGNYWDSPWAPVPVDRVENQLLANRGWRYDAGQDFTAQTFGVNVMPTFQIQFGKVAAFTSWTFTWMKTTPVQKGPEPWYLDPYRGLVLRYEEWIYEHTTAMVYEIKNGKDHTSMLRVGALIRGKWVEGTPDATLMTGPVVMWRPGKRSHDATILTMLAPYLQDPDFKAGIPYFAVLVSSNKAIPLRWL